MTSAFGQPYTMWRDYAGSADSAQYSGLRQINRANVSQLQVAWVYPTGDGAKYSFNPIVIDELMVVLGKGNSIVALNAATGKEVWSYSPGADTKIITNRGINYWESKDRSERRLLFASNHFLRAIVDRSV
jgi:quinoprotein glucose dehydrogenase